MKKIKAFTLIETIIAISVFCVGILTVLLWVAQTIKNQNYAATQIKSAFFAREWIELMFNLRDANYHKELPWNCLKVVNESDTDKEACKNNEISPWTILSVSITDDDKYIDVDVIDDISDTSDLLNLDPNNWDTNDENYDDYVAQFDEIFNRFQIYRHTWGEDTPIIYNHIEEDWEETWFARFILISDVKWLSSSHQELIDDNLVKIESHVLYNKWGLRWEKVMETFIWNYEFEY